MSARNELEELNVRFGLNGAVRFQDAPGGLTRARIATDTATAEIYLQGAHVTQWKPARAEHPVLFLSEKSHFAPGKAIRGGVPLVFPWFAERKGGLPGGMHGFARTLPWEVVAAERRAEGVALSFKLLPNQTTCDLGFDHFVLVYEVVVGEQLSLALEVENVGDSPLTFEEALHAYYSISDVRQIEISGVGDTDYLDRADNAKRKHLAAGAIRFAGETDQLHLHTQSAVTISDPEWRRRIVIEKHRSNSTGSNSTVVWNPWQAKASALADLGADAWPHFVCVEPANAAENAVRLPPGSTHRMGITVRVETA